MELRLTPRFLVAFAALLFVMHESHEIVHTVIARLICGCWGPRDFNVWSTCEACANPQLAQIATFAGPAYTFAMIWWGFLLLKPGRPVPQQAVGFALIFANMPLARMLTAVLGGGDEVWGLTQLMGGRTIPWAIGLTVVLVLGSGPLVRVWRALAPRRRWLILVGFLVAPVVLDGVVVLLVLNTLLTRGILATLGLLGSPVFVNL